MSTISRRTFLTGTGLAASAVIGSTVLSACSNGPGRPPEVTTPAQGVPASTAAETFGWGDPIGGSEFSDPSLLAGGYRQWVAWDGPGYQGNGVQSPEQVTISDGILRITGTPEGRTGAVAYFGATQRYGRWESRIRVPVADKRGLYHPVALLWPETGQWPAAGEIDYFESSSEAGAPNSFSVHHGGTGSPDVGEVPSDGDWHNWAVEWTPTAINAYKDGVLYRTLTDTTLFPPGPMWHSFQLDWVPWKNPGVVAPDILMEVDWLRVYAL